MMRFNIVFSMGDGWIKFLQAAVLPKRSLTAWEVIDTTGQSDEAMSQTLRGFAQKLKVNWGQSNLTVLIPRSRVMVRQMTLPSLKEEEIRSMIDLQLGADMPYAREEVEVDFQILHQTSDGYSLVAIVIIPQDVAMRYEKIFSDAQLPIGRMTISSVGLWLLYQQQPDRPSGLGGIVDVDVNTSEICLCTKSYWLTSRGMPIGYSQMERDGYAEFLKQWDITQKSLGHQVPGSVQSVYIFCSKDISLLQEAMAKVTHTKINTVDLSPLSTLENPSFASLAGVALSSLPIPIDLTPRAVKDLRNKSMYKRQLRASGIWVLAAVSTMILAGSIGFLMKSIVLGTWQQELKSLQPKTAMVESQLQKVSNIEDQLKARVVFSNLAGELARILPAQISLINIAITDGHTLSLQGMSLNPEDINQFQQRMVETPGFSKVNLDYVKRRLTNQGQVSYFKITCVLGTQGRKIHEEIKPT